ncbi:IS481 family transposase, partial [Arthrobacter sp. zg-ZUI227]|nr:IS481 family transposase [Arthrobacter jiangjiafuii]
HERPHRALDRKTPVQAYNATVKAVPLTARQGGHWRVRVDRIDTTGKVSLRYAGRLRHIGLGRAYAGKHILMLIHEQDIVITETATGEILRELTLDPSRDYQPRQKKTPRSEDRGVTYVATHP